MINFTGVWFFYIYLIHNMVLLYTWYIDASLNSCGFFKQRKFPKINVCTSDYQMHKNVSNSVT